VIMQSENNSLIKIKNASPVNDIQFISPIMSRQNNIDEISCHQVKLSKSIKEKYKFSHFQLKLGPLSKSH
jgi:predicted nucleic acid-binding protein